MIQKYYLLSEILGYFGIIVFVVNCLILMPSYIKAFKSSKKVFSVGGFLANILLVICQVALVILFITNLINPEVFSNQGKTDLITSKFTIGFSISLLVFVLVDFFINGFFQKHFLVYLYDDNICFSYNSYEKDDLIIENFKIFYCGRRTKKLVSVKNKLGKFICINYDIKRKK